MIRKNNKTNTIVCRYDSVGELSSLLNATTAQPFFKDAQESQETGKRSTKFTGSKTYEDADNLLLHGDKDLQKKIESAGVAKTRAKLTGKGTRREIYSSVAGFAAHVPNYIAGVPTSMLNVRQKRAAVPVIDLYYVLQAACDETTDDIIKASAKVISAAMQIEASGVRLNIYTLVASQKHGQYIVFGCKIKTSGQPFDTLKMAYPMAHPSMLRRHFFKVVETTEGVDNRFVSSYGAPVTDKGMLKALLKNNGVTNDKSQVIEYYEAKRLSVDEMVKSIAG